MAINCITCYYAQRDKHGRFVDRCMGYGNCDYEEYQGEVKPTMEEQMKALIENADKITEKDPVQAYKEAVLKCIQIVEDE